ncbi:MAG: filamentous hemagglutinin N-terminal domain-containing protein [Elainellaceae cyanobacterium]
MLLASGTDSTFRQVVAQVRPDNTLGGDRSIVTPSGNSDRISGGAQRGGNLFHSFRRFDVGANRVADFATPAGINAVIGRVTGGDRSEIFGTLRVSGASPSANLFLINPSGILFGETAQLDVAGAFLATTADSLLFDGDIEFSATNPQPPPLLTVNTPTGLQFGATPRPIINRAQAREVVPSLNVSLPGLQVSEGSTLTLVGGEVTNEGGGLIAPNGRVDLGGLADAGQVALDVVGSQIRLRYPTKAPLADVTFSEEALVEVLQGSIQLTGRRISLANDSRVQATNFTSQPGRPVRVQALERLEVLSGSLLATETFSGFGGSGGNLLVETQQLVTRGGGAIRATTGAADGIFSLGDGGRLVIRASDSVMLVGTTTVDGTVQPSGLFTQTETSGRAGNLRVETQRLILRGGAQISASTFASGEGGNIAIIAADSVQLSGTAESAGLRIPVSGILATTQLESSGDAGRLRVETGELLVEDGAAIAASSSRGNGDGGSLVIRAESITLRGIADNGARSGLLVGAEGSGSAGRLRIDTDRLLVQNGAFVSARIIGFGEGGTITLNAADSVQIVGTSTDGTPSSLQTQVLEDGSGDAGNVRLNTPRLSLRDGGVITSRNDGFGLGGNLRIDADTVQMVGNSQIVAETASGNAGNIILRAQDLLALDDNSRISTTAGSLETDGDGGNITIASQWVVANALGNSDITANAFDGQGGQVRLTAREGVIGLMPRSRAELEDLLDPDAPLEPSLLQSSDITAISQNNPSLDGQIILDTPDTLPDRQRAELPETLAAPQLQQRCYASQSSSSSSFVNVGRGGRPPQPTQASNSLTVWEDLRSPQQGSTIGASAAVVEGAIAPRHQEQPIEAQGWIVGPDGEIILTAQATPAQGGHSWRASAATCAPS